MLKRALLTLALLATVPALPGCSVYQAYLQRAAIEQAKFQLRSFSIDSIDFMGANVTITLELENPTDTELQLDQIEYTLFVNDMRALSGQTAASVHVPVHDSRPLPIHTSVRFADVSGQVRGLIASGAHYTYRVEGVGHFSTPFGPIDYPIHISSPSR